MVDRSLKFEVDRELFPFESRFLELENGIRVHYVDEGKGPTILMLHGNPSWSFLYRKMILALRNSYRCIALDYPGFGLTEAPPDYGFTPGEHSEIVEKFVAGLELTSLTLVVQDWGGPVGLGFAGRNPGLVDRLVIGNTFAWPLQGDLGVAMFSLLMGGPVGRSIAYLFNGVARFFFWKGLVNKPDERVLQMYLAPFHLRRNRKQTSISPRLLLKARPYLQEVESGLSRIADRPTLLLWGTRDFAFKESARKRFEETFSDTKTVLLEASHFWQDDCGEEAAEAIREWMGA